MALPPTLVAAALGVVVLVVAALRVRAGSGDPASVALTAAAAIAGVVVVDLWQVGAWEVVLPAGVLGLWLVTFAAKDAQLRSDNVCEITPCFDVTTRKTEEFAAMDLETAAELEKGLAELMLGRFVAVLARDDLHGRSLMACLQLDLTQSFVNSRMGADVEGQRAGKWQIWPQRLPKEAGSPPEQLDSLRDIVVVEESLAVSQPALAEEWLRAFDGLVVVAGAQDDGRGAAPRIHRIRLAAADARPWSRWRVLVHAFAAREGRVGGGATAIQRAGGTFLDVLDRRIAPTSEVDTLLHVRRRDAVRHLLSDGFPVIADVMARARNGRSAVERYVTCLEAAEMLARTFVLVVSGASTPKAPEQEGPDPSWSFGSWVGELRRCGPRGQRPTPAAWLAPALETLFERVDEPVLSERFQALGPEFRELSPKVSGVDLLEYLVWLRNHTRGHGQIDRSLCRRGWSTVYSSVAFLLERMPLIAQAALEVDGGLLRGVSRGATVDAVLGCEGGRRDRPAQILVAGGRRVDLGSWIAVGREGPMVLVGSGATGRQRWSAVGVGSLRAPRMGG